MAKRIPVVGPTTPAGQALSQRLFSILRVDLAFMYAIVFAMVVKPTTDDGWTIAIVVAVLRRAQSLRRSPRYRTIIPRTVSQGGCPLEFTSRLAVPEDVVALTVLMERAIAELQRAFLDEAQIASSRAIMGIDTQLIDDRTFFVVESGTDIAGCGGWSRRATLYGGNQTPGRDSNLLDPSVHPARVRAMYTSPAYARRGVGRLILSLCEAAAAAEGFTRLELMSTLSGEPLYTAYGFRPLERLEDSTGGAPVPLVRMEKPVDPRLLR